MFDESGCLRYFANVEVAEVHFVFEMIEKGFKPAVSLQSTTASLERNRGVT